MENLTQETFSLSFHSGIPIFVWISIGGPVHKLLGPNHESQKSCHSERYPRYPKFWRWDGRTISPLSHFSPQRIVKSHPFWRSSPIDNPHQTDLVVNIMQWRPHSAVQRDILPHHQVHSWCGKMSLYLRQHLWDASYHLQAKIARGVNNVREHRWWKMNKRANTMPMNKAGTDLTINYITRGIGFVCSDVCFAFCTSKR